MRCKCRGSKVVRVSAGPGVLAEGPGGMLVASWWIDDRTLAERGSVDAEMSSSSDGMIVGAGDDGFVASGVEDGEHVGDLGGVFLLDFGVGTLNVTVRMSLSGGITCAGRAWAFVGDGYTLGSA